MRIHYVFTPDGSAFENPEMLPLDGLPHGPSALRVVLDDDARRIWIQDESARKALGEGAKEAWELLNKALLGIDQRHDLRFLDRSYGDPEGMNVRRRLSRYPSWSRLVRFMGEEFNSVPVDVSVVEHCDPSKPDMAFIPGDDPVILANRNAFLCPGGDQSFNAMSDALFRYYLRNLREIMTAFPAEWERFGPRYDRWRGKTLQEAFFAVKSSDGVRLFRMPMDEGGAPTGQEEIEKSVGDAPYVIFVHEPDSRNVALLNMLPAHADEELLRGLIERVAKSSKLSPQEMVLTFDPALSKPFVTRLSSYVIARDVLDEAKWIGQDIRVVEAPVDVVGDATVIPSPEEEDNRAPTSKRYRAVNGIDVRYPFLLVDSRIRSKGKKLRAILDALCPSHDPLSKLDEEQFTRLARGPLREAIRARVDYLSEMGLDNRSVLDLMTGADLVRRAEIREIMGAPRIATAAKVADFGPELGINDWWHLGLQETLNRAQHKDETPKKRPYNLKRVRALPATIEEMLRFRHDKEMTAQKITEELLRESQI